MSIERRSHHPMTLMNTRLALRVLAAAPILALSAHAEDPVNFEKSIFTIFEAKCLKCHASEHTDETGKVKKPKAGFAMDTPEGLTKGGKHAKEKTLVAGKPEESALYVSTTLAPTEDEAMPPEGKADPLTDEEKALLKRWIAEGAKFGDWKGKPKK
jgi:uncharacterized membrane protein